MDRTCQKCGGSFHGRADATYCSAACRQKAYRSRNVTGSGDVTDSWRKHHLGRAPTKTIIGKRPATLARNITTAALTEAAGLATAFEYVYLDEVPTDIATPDQIDAAIESVQAALALLLDLKQR